MAFRSPRSSTGRWCRCRCSEAILQRLGSTTAARIEFGVAASARGRPPWREYCRFRPPGLRRRARSDLRFRRATASYEHRRRSSIASSLPQHPVGSPVADQFDSGTFELPLVRGKLLFEPGQQREGIGGTAGESDDHLHRWSDGEPCFAPSLITELIEGDLAVAGDAPRARRASRRKHGRTSDMHSVFHHSNRKEAQFSFGGPGWPPESSNRSSPEDDVLSRSASQNWPGSRTRKSGPATGGGASRPVVAPDRRLTTRTSRAGMSARSSRSELEEPTSTVCRPNVRTGSRSGSELFEARDECAGVDLRSIATVRRPPGHSCATAISFAPSRGSSEDAWLIVSQSMSRPMDTEHDPVRIACHGDHYETLPASKAGRLRNE